MKYFNYDKINKYKWLLNCIVYLINLWPQKRLVSNLSVQKILVIDLHLIGDIVMLTPFLVALRKKYPGAKIYLLAGSWSKIVLKGFENEIDKIYTVNVPWVKRISLQDIKLFIRTLYDFKKEKIDLGFDMRGDFRNSLILKLVGVKQRVGFDLMMNGGLLTNVVSAGEKANHITDYHAQLGISCQIFDNSYSYIPKLKNVWGSKLKKQIGIHLGASLNLKQFPNAYIGNLLDDIINSEGLNIHLRIFKIPEIPNLDKEILDYSIKKGLNAHIFSGNLENFFYGLSECEKLYCLDSGPGHIAAAMGAEVVSYFGPTDPKFCAPIGENVKIIQKNKPPKCWPCEALNCVNINYKECFELYE